MSAHVLLNLLNELGEKDKMRGWFSSMSKINSIIQEHDSIYHMALESNFVANFALKHHDFAIRKCDI